MILRQLQQMLDDNRIKYVVISHSPAFTALEIAEVSHIPRRELAKTVVLNIDNQPVMVVVPASHMVDFKRLKRMVNAHTLLLTNEREFNALFPNCEVGAMPPFGSLFNLRVIVASALTGDEHLCFNAGTHYDLIKMSTLDYLRLVKPEVLDFSIPRRILSEDHYLDMK